MSALEPLRRSTRNTLLVTDLGGALASLAFLVVFFIRENSDPIRLTLAVLGVVVFMVLHVRSVLRAIQGPWLAFPMRHTYGMAGLVIAMTCLMATVDGASGALGGLYAGLAASEFFIARPARFAWRHTGIVTVAHAVALGAMIVLTGQSDELGAAIAASVIVVPLTAFSIGVAYRQWEAALKLEEARRDAAELATTRERLRLAEDLHDILGHALEVVSLKSELAVRLTDPARSKSEMAEVQRLARDALRDVRALAHGNRPTDLATELTGARNLLHSAGIKCDFQADPAGLTQRERELLGRVLREAMTNALRHADPGTCGVTLEVQPDQVVLKVVNDGVVLVGSEQGTGLTGLARRVTAAGGEFVAGRVEPASFQVIASLPR